MAVRPRIVVAMSGGVDSSTAAALLCQSGVDVVGVTLKLYDASGTAASIGGRCCSPRDIEDARATAAALGFPHYVLDESEAFTRAVIDDFLGAYRAGRTPNPCVRCNETLKFDPLVRFARAIGAEALATGHYARVEAGPAGVRLRRAVDRQKDQAYFLFAVRPALFPFVRFPLGSMTKQEVRQVAEGLGLPNWNKPDSQQICFIPDGDHRRFVQERGGGGPAGEIVDEGGVALAQHEGTHHFTIGQRKGLPPSRGGEARFVLRIDVNSGKVVVGPRQALGRRAMRVSDTRWLNPLSPAQLPLRCEVQIRHHASPHPAILTVDNDAAEVSFAEPVEGIAPGQAAVFFAGEDVLGGGWIADAQQPP
jgi:tRNA-uridine 2-sulfurtransferase